MTEAIEEILVPETATPGMNPELIEKYFFHEDREFGLQQLKTLLDFSHRQRHRAEFLCRTFMDKMVKLEIELQRLKSGETSSLWDPKTNPKGASGAGLDLARKKAQAPAQAQASAPRKTSTSTVEGLDL